MSKTNCVECAGGNLHLGLWLNTLKHPAERKIARQRLDLMRLKRLSTI